MDIFFQTSFQSHGDLPNVCHFLRPLKTGPSWLHIGACPSVGWILLRPVVLTEGNGLVLLMKKNLATLPETNSSPMKIPIFPGKYHQNGGFSWAMLVYRRVTS